MSTSEVNELHVASRQEFDDPMLKSEAMLELSKKLGLMESVRLLCQSLQVPIPGIVVVGEQSAGKSSLLENISGIQFPRAQNTCTRMPCVLTLQTSAQCTNPHARVSLKPNFEDAEECILSEVSGKIDALTEQHATSNKFISKDPIYVRVVRSQGPQLSLIDLPGLTHNADQMENIHEVTKDLVEEYIKQEEMVILCVIPALSDFGNAEVIKLARMYDPEGRRTLGVVTKCDDAANAEFSDVVDKVMMTRPSDIKLKLGFHCVINRSQKNIAEGLSHADLWEKEANIFSKSERFRHLPTERRGTLSLMQKVARIQEAHVDECLPRIKDTVRIKISELRKQLWGLPTHPQSDEECHQHFDVFLRKIRDDLQRRVRAEFMSSQPHDEEFAIAPRVADMVSNFRNSLRKENPSWLACDMLDKVEDIVQKYVNGYTVDNLVGPQIFVNLIKRIFVEEGLLADSASELANDIADHLRKVVIHVIQFHTSAFPGLENYFCDTAYEVIDECLKEANELAKKLAEAQQVTSTTHRSYMVKLTNFRRSWFAKKVEDTMQHVGSAFVFVETEKDASCSLPKEFIAMVESAPDNPQKLAVLEISASLYVYTNMMIECFTDMAAKLIKFNLVEVLTDKLEMSWRRQLGAGIKRLFPMDSELKKQKEDLEHKLNQLVEFKNQFATLRVSTALHPKSQVCGRFGQAHVGSDAQGASAIPVERSAVATSLSVSKLKQDADIAGVAPLPTPKTSAASTGWGQNFRAFTKPSGWDKNVGVGRRLRD